MNIKILEPISEDLVQVTIPFGSRVYGTAGPNSDYDYIKILKKPAGQLVLQYQNATVDYVYTDLDNFRHLATTGGNILMFEVSQSIEFADWYGHTLNYDVYATTKAYLGLAKRDLHYPERLHHAYRCYQCAYTLFQTSRLDLNELKYLAGISKAVTVDDEMLRSAINELRIDLNHKYKKI